MPQARTARRVEQDVRVVPLAHSTEYSEDLHQEKTSYIFSPTGYAYWMSLALLHLKKRTFFGNRSPCWALICCNID